jgi:hypothetical protein
MTCISPSTDPALYPCREYKLNVEINAEDISDSQYHGFSALLETFTNYLTKILSKNKKMK